MKEYLGRLYKAIKMRLCLRGKVVQCIPLLAPRARLISRNDIVISQKRLAQAPGIKKHAADEEWEQEQRDFPRSPSFGFQASSSPHPHPSLLPPPFLLSMTHTLSRGTVGRKRMEWWREREEENRWEIEGREWSKEDERRKRERMRGGMWKS